MDVTSLAVDLGGVIDDGIVVCATESLDVMLEEEATELNDDVPVGCAETETDSTTHENIRNDSNRGR